MSRARRAAAAPGRPDELDIVLAFREVFARHDFRCGAWVERAGSLPYFAFAPEVLAFLRALDETQLVYDFAWHRWRQAGRYVDSPPRVARASLATLRKLLTAHVRGEPYMPGHLAAVFQTGHMLIILERLHVLRSRMDALPRRTRQ